MILTYKYRFVVLLYVHSFVTYSCLCYMIMHSWNEVSIWDMDKYMDDRMKLCTMVNVIPGGMRASW